MERGNRVLLAAAVAAFPAMLLLGMLFFQLKKIDVANLDVEAELQLGRQKRQRLTLQEQLEEASADAPSAKSGAAADPETPS